MASRMDPGLAPQMMILQFLAANGPASRADIAAAFPGMKPVVRAEAVAHLAGRGAIAANGDAIPRFGVPRATSRILQGA